MAGADWQPKLGAPQPGHLSPSPALALLQRLLLLPLLAPLLAVLLVAAINPRPAVALRLLTWTSPALPIGLWLSLAVCGGGALSAGATSLALRNAPGAGPKARRTASAGSDEGSWSVWPEAEPATSQSRPPSNDRPPAQSAPQPVRPPGEPAPTVAVPFRVIRKGKGPSQEQAPPEEPRRQSVSVGDGWDQAISDDW